MPENAAVLVISSHPRILAATQQHFAADTSAPERRIDLSACARWNMNDWHYK